MGDDRCTVILTRHPLDSEEDGFFPSGLIEDSRAQLDARAYVSLSARSHEFGNVMASEPLLELLMLKGDTAITSPGTHQCMVARQHLQHSQRLRLTGYLALLPQLRERRRNNPAGVGLRHRD